MLTQAITLPDGARVRLFPAPSGECLAAVEGLPLGAGSESVRITARRAAAEHALLQICPDAAVTGAATTSETGYLLWYVEVRR